MSFAQAPDASLPWKRPREGRAAAGRNDGPSGRSAAAYLMLDAPAAAVFAAGLAIAIGGGRARLIEGALLMIAGAAARGLLARAAIAAGARAAAALKRGLRVQAMAGLLRPGAAGPIGVGEGLAVAVDAVEALDGWAVRYAPAQAAARVAPLLALAAMALASPVSAVIVLVAFAPFAAGMALAGGAAAGAARAQQAALERLSGRFVDRIRALPAILAFGGEARAAQGVGRSAADLAERTLSVLRVAFLSSAILEFFAALSVALVAVYCGFSLLGLLPFHPPERLDLTRAVFVLALAPEAYLPFRRLAAAYHEKETAAAAQARLAPVIEAGAAARAPAAPLRMPPRIRFEAVSLTYPGASRAALEGVDLTIAPGECVALVGSSGCGKSSLLRLALGLCAPSTGRVTLDGRPTGGQRAAWVDASPVTTPGSLAQNIALASPGAGSAAIARAAQRAGLPLGWLGRPIDERGGGLSGGERRRLALARAFLADCPLVLMDEPTADLDEASAAFLLPALADLAAGRTTLIATHSPTVAALADRVVRLEHVDPLQAESPEGGLRALESNV